MGRSAAAKQFDPTAIRLAVIAHIRHKYTKYDKLLARHDDRQLARGAVQPTIEKVLCRWEGGTNQETPCSGTVVRTGLLQGLYIIWLGAILRIP